MGEVICIAPLTSGAGSKTFKMNNVLNTKEQQHCSQNVSNSLWRFIWKKRFQMKELMTGTYLSLSLRSSDT